MVGEIGFFTGTVFLGMFMIIYIVNGVSFDGEYIQKK